MVGLGQRHSFLPCLGVSRALALEKCGVMPERGAPGDHLSGQIIATSHDLTPKCSVLEGKSPYF